MTWRAAAAGAAAPAREPSLRASGLAPAHARGMPAKARRAASRPSGWPAWTRKRRLTLLIAATSACALLGLFFVDPSRPAAFGLLRTSSSPSDAAAAVCQDRWFYIYDLPPEFNTRLLEAKKCDDNEISSTSMTSSAISSSSSSSTSSTSSFFSLWGRSSSSSSSGSSGGSSVSAEGDASVRCCSKECLSVASNLGLGNTNDYGFTRGGPAFGPGTGWYSTGEMSLELYFYHRMQRHPCRTRIKSKATAFYIPYFPTLHLLAASKAAPATKTAAGSKRRRREGVGGGTHMHMHTGRGLLQLASAQRRVGGEGWHAAVGGRGKPKDEDALGMDFFGKVGKEAEDAEHGSMEESKHEGGGREKILREDGDDGDGLVEEQQYEQRRHRQRKQTRHDHGSRKKLKKKRKHKDKEGTTHRDDDDKPMQGHGNNKDKEQLWALLEELHDTLHSSAEFHRSRGADHFVVSAQPWASVKQGLALLHKGGKFLKLAQRMMVVSPECSGSGKRGRTAVGCNAAGSRELAVPYLSFFHPSSADELSAHGEWMVKNEQRELMASVAVSERELPKARRGKRHLRNVVLLQCRESARCAALICSPEGQEGPAAGVNPGGLNRYGNCQDTSTVMDLYYQSHFCLQPPGAGQWTRKGIFDALLAGCIPVLFSPVSAELQYQWDLPNATSWSVLLDPDRVRRRGIVKLLSLVHRNQRHALRTRIRSLLRAFTYVHPDFALGSGGSGSSGGGRWWQRSAAAAAAGLLSSRVGGGHEGAFGRSTSNSNGQEAADGGGPDANDSGIGDAFDRAVEAVLSKAALFGKGHTGDALGDAKASRKKNGDAVGGNPEDMGAATSSRISQGDEPDDMSSSSSSSAGTRADPSLDPMDGRLADGSGDDSEFDPHLKSSSALSLQANLGIATWDGGAKAARRSSASDAAREALRSAAEAAGEEGEDSGKGDVAEGSRLEELEESVKGGSMRSMYLKHAEREDDVGEDERDGADGAEFNVD